MIQANELRIGNIAKDRGGKILKIDRFYGNKIECDIKGMPDKDPDTGIKLYYHPLTEQIQFLEPIPLTEDWLLKMPCEIGEWDSETEMFYFEKSEFIIEKLSNGYFVFRPYSTCNFDVKLKSVHHWQNLYFALTGTELELKNENN
jgi:hypothetical protein